MRRKLLHVHRGERADHLLEGLCALLAEPPPDAFAPEVVAVHTRGMERWLAQTLSGRLGAGEGRSDGMCANVDFPFPGRLSRDAVAVASGVDPDTDPWLPERLLWFVIDVIDDHIDDEWLSELALYIRGPEGSAPDARQGRRLAIARQIAERFDRYALLRPNMVKAWSTGGNTDGEGNSLLPSSVWQAELWRRVSERISVAGPADRIESACERLAAGEVDLDLPDRISLFGLTRLPVGHQRVLQALASARDVHCFVLHPSPVLWEKVAGLPKTGEVLRRSEDPTSALPSNPLLRSWGKDARELQVVLTGSQQAAEQHHGREREGKTLLSRLQADVIADRLPAGAEMDGGDDPLPELDPGDLSVQIHACHGRARQVEVLREAILHALRENPSLEPRDVIVMCPDIETFAPLIHATFGGAEVDSADVADSGPDVERLPGLRVRLADRALRQTNPVLGVVARVLELVGGRLSASQVLDLADREPVRRRFRLDDNDLAQLEAWVSASGIHWGLDAPHRESFQLASVPEGTWRAGLDRVLLGVAMSEDDNRLFGEVLPLDDVGSGTIDLAGRLAEFVNRLTSAVDRLTIPQPIAGWAQAIRETADALTATPPWEDWQRTELGRLLDDIVREAQSENTASTELNLPELRALLGDRLQGRPTWANFRTGHLTICTLMPMRSVPHRVVCLLGLDDGAFPRHAARNGDDLTLLDPHLGERDARMEDRQLLLDALLSATDRLIVTYTGNDERTNAPRPAAVPVGELLDVIDQTVRVPDGPAARCRPRSATRCSRSTLATSPRASYARTDHGASSRSTWKEHAHSAPSDDVPWHSSRDRSLRSPTPRWRSTTSSASFSIRCAPFCASGSESVSIPPSRSLRTAFRSSLTALEQWQIGQRMLEARLAGATTDEAVAAELARGELPPGRLGQPVIDQISDTVEGLLHEIDALPASEGDAGVL